MDHKKSPMRRTKRQAKVLEDNYWDCSVCTYRNNAEAFKCLMCDVRKGTSTRKPRINPALAAAQQQAGTTAAGGVAGSPLAAAGSTTGPGGKESSSGAISKRAHHHHRHRHHNQRGSGGSTGSRRVHSASHPPRLKNVDRSSAQTREVTVNSVTVVITEYKPIAVTQLQNASAGAASSESSDRGSLSESSDARS